MTAQRNYRVYVEDILDAIARIRRYTTDGEKAFLSNEMTQDAVIRQISIIGEAAARLPNAVRAAAPDIPWKRVIGMRNILIHEYSDTSIQRVWTTVQDHLPQLADAIPRLLEEADAIERQQRRTA